MLVFSGEELLFVNVLRSRFDRVERMKYWKLEMRMRSCPLTKSSANKVA